MLGYLAQGMSNKEIARALDLGPETVKWHLKSVFAKLNAGSRRHAVNAPGCSACSETLTAPAVFPPLWGGSASSANCIVVPVTGRAPASEGAVTTRRPDADPLWPGREMHCATSAGRQEETMIRRLTAIALIGALIGALALAVFERLQTPAAPADQTPAGFPLHNTSIRDLFP